MRLQPNLPGKIRIIGFDPGLRFTGWGIVDKSGNQLSLVGHGVVTSKASDTLGDRLAQLFDKLQKVLNEFSPDEAAVEETFVNKNPTSTLKLGMARGVVMLAPAFFKIPVSEYSANRVKKSVVGVGHADKHQVQTMVHRLLPGAGASKADSADALAVAICHAHWREYNNTELSA